MHPADLADVAEAIPVEQVPVLLARCRRTARREVLEYLDEELRAEVLEAMTAQQAAELVTEMTPDERADVLEELEEETRRRDPRRDAGGGATRDAEAAHATLRIPPAAS